MTKNTLYDIIVRIHLTQQFWPCSSRVCHDVMQSIAALQSKRIYSMQRDAVHYVTKNQDGF